MVTLQDELAELTGEVDHGLWLLRIAHECGFGDLERQLLADLVDISMTALIGALSTDGEPRKRYAELVRRISETVVRTGDHTAASAWDRYCDECSAEKLAARVRH